MFIAYPRELGSWRQNEMLGNKVKHEYHELGGSESDDIQYQMQ